MAGRGLELAHGHILWRFCGRQRGEVRTGSSHKQARCLLSAAGSSATALLADCCSARYAFSDAFLYKNGLRCTRVVVFEVRWGQSG